MSTTALIEIPSGDEFWIGSDGVPRTMKEIIGEIVETALDNAKEYKNPNDNWTRELRIVMRDKADDNWSGIERHDGMSKVNHYYKINKAGQLLHKKERDGDWTMIKDFETRQERRGD